MRAAVNAPLPPGWEEYLDDAGDAAFRNPKVYIFPYKCQTRVPPPSRIRMGMTPYTPIQRFVTSLPTDNCPQPKEALPAVSTLTLPY